MPPPRQYTLGSILADPEPVLALIRRKFPRVNWERVSLNTPEIRAALERAAEEIADDPKLREIVIERLKDHIDYGYSIFENALPGIGSAPHQIAYAQAKLFATIVLESISLHTQRIFLDKLLNEHMKKFDPVLDQAIKKYPSLNRVFLRVTGVVVPRKKLVRNPRKSRARVRTQPKARMEHLLTNDEGAIIN